MPAWLGVFSIIILVWGLISIILGLVKGFMNKAVRIVAIVAVFVLGFFFAGSLADLLMSGNVPPSNAIKELYVTNLTAKGVVEGDFIKTMEGAGIPAWVGAPLWFCFGKPQVTDVPGTATAITKLFMTLISYGIILVGVLIVFGILAAIIKGLREFAVVKFIDGFLGVILYVGIMLVTIWTVFAIFKIILDNNPTWVDNAFFKWIINDMKLDYVEENKGVFNIGKALYNNNLVYYLINMFIIK